MDTRYLLGIAVAVVLGWFALGTLYNVRRGEAMLHWMRGGLPKIGERTTLRWLGSSVAELKIERARAPFRSMETLVVLSPRDVPFMWVWAWLRGRRDTLIFRGGLSSTARCAFELADPGSWTGRMAIDDAQRAGWEGGPFVLSGGSLIPASSGPAASEPGSRRLQLMAPRGTLAAALGFLPTYLPLVENLDARFVRLQLRREPPVLELHVPLPDPRRREAAEYFDLLRQLAQSAGAANRGVGSTTG